MVDEKREPDKPAGAAAPPADGRAALAAVPAPVLDLLAAARAAGGRTWLVGGTVRDLLRGAAPLDWDVATDLRPDAMARAWPAADLRDERLGACRLRLDGVPGAVTATTLRRESDYTDHRHPDRVEFVDDPVEDAARRDFTVNAIYLDPVDGSLLDPTGGRADLAERVLRAVGEPTARFAEDALRLLRALRFAALLDAALDPETERAARAAAPLLRHLSAPRVFDELTRTFTGPNRGRALRRAVDLGFLDVVLPEVPPMDGVPQPPQFHPEGDVLTHVCMVLDEVPAGAPALAWAAVLHDVGKPPTFVRAADRIRFDGHDVLSAHMAEAALRRLGAPRELRETVVELCRDHIRIASLMAMRPRRRERWLRSPRFAAHLEFHRADCLASHGDLSIYAAARAELAALPPVAAAVLRGADVVALGVPEGPMVGELLRAAERALEARGSAATTREEALATLREVVGARIKRDA